MARAEYSNQVTFEQKYEGDKGVNSGKSEIRAFQEGIGSAKALRQKWACVLGRAEKVGRMVEYGS